jgi:FeS assembly protein IscX
MKWTDSREIAIALPRNIPTSIRARCCSRILKRWVQELPGFDDDPKHCGEKILEAIQMTWMDEGEFDDD